MFDQLFNIVRHFLRQYLSTHWPLMSQFFCITVSCKIVGLLKFLLISFSCTCQEAAKLVQPSLKREGFSSIPAVKWEDVGGLDSLRKEFDKKIIQWVKNPEKFEVMSVLLQIFVHHFISSLMFDSCFVCVLHFLLLEISSSFYSCHHT